MPKPVIAIASILLTSCCIQLSAQQWPQYRGPDATGKIETAQLELGSLKPTVHWRVPTTLGFSSFSVASGKAITLVARDGQEVCLALNSDTGEEIWARVMGPADYQHNGGNTGAQGNKGGDGPRSTPSISGDKVFVYDAHLHLYCLSLDTGAIVWQHDIMGQYGGENIKWKNATSPVLYESMVVVAGGGTDHAFLAFEQSSGKLLWHSGTEGLTHATAATANINNQKQIIFLMQSGLIAVNPNDGNEIWRSAFPFDVSTAASPIISGNQIYASAGYGVGAGLYAIDTDNKPTELWRRPNRLINHWSSPVLLDGHLYGIYKFKRFGKAPLQCVELATGEIKWKQSGYGQGNCIVIGDKVIALSDAGELAIVSASPKEYKELWRDKLLDGKCWSTPAFSDGKIFIRSTKEAVCLSFQSPDDN